MTTAIVSLACRYPDAANPDALWANVLAGRRSFRAMPPERLELARYASDLIGEADSITPIKVAVLTGWNFNRERFLIPQATFESGDLTHWLALEVAAEAIERGGGIGRFNRERTAVVVANTLTGEFSRASMLRLRLPFLDEILANAVRSSGVSDAQAQNLRRHFASALRERFPAPQEDTLSGGLANTIAGRIANYFDLRGGAYTVDGACASSLLAVANAIELLDLDQADSVIVGGVDLSLDPFELVGFSRNGALARDDMRVFDARSNGFWPGEGAAFTVLMREKDARERGLPIAAVIRGWGISTDGAGGFTRPAVDGQILALRRAYKMAGVDPEDVGYVEAHGTGTVVGDQVEVRALATMRNGAANPLPIGSIKANIGHTKAAAGFAGLVKAVSALNAGIVPPHVSCGSLHPVFAEVDHRVRPSLVPSPWPEASSRLAGVSSFGFGGINAHVVLEKACERGQSIVVPPMPPPLDAEIFAVSGATAADVSAKLAVLKARAPTLTMSEMGDVAAHLASIAGAGPHRVAIVADTPDALERKLALAADAVGGSDEIFDIEQGVFVATRSSPARIGFLFPGQAAPVRLQGGIWPLHFDDIAKLMATVPDASNFDLTNTSTAQPAIIAASLAALRVLRACGIDAAASIGHSLGELTALAWAGAIDENDLVSLATARGAVMAYHAQPGGTMMRIAASSDEVRGLIAGLDLTVACENGPNETVVSGSLADVDEATARASRRGYETTPLAVSHAFHSPMMAPATEAFAAAISGYAVEPVTRRVISTVLGRAFCSTDDISQALTNQIVNPVCFDEALRQMHDVDLLIEVGPGAGLTRLARDAGYRAVATDAFGDSLRPLLNCIAAAFTIGAPVCFDPIFNGRPWRPIDLAERPQFLANPCGRRNEAFMAPLAPLDGEPLIQENSNDGPRTNVAPQRDALSAVFAAIASETGFDAKKIDENSRFLDHLHLNSISVARIVTNAARALSLRIPETPTEFANATARQLAAGLTALDGLTPAAPRDIERIPGVRPWVQTFSVRWRERPIADCAPNAIGWNIISLGQQNHGIRQNAPSDPASVSGLLIWLGENVDEGLTYDLFAACRSVWNDERISHLAICHAGASVAAFARSIAIEGRFNSVTVVEQSPENADPDLIWQELARERPSFYEVRIDGQGRGFEPDFSLCTPDFNRRATLDRRDVVLVTGGGKGIGAECALRLASKTGAALVLAGRSPPQDPAVVATLERARALGLRCKYVIADATDGPQLAAAVAPASEAFGPITALLHVAGMNEPMLFQKVTDDDLRDVLAPKTIGLRSAIAAAGPSLRRVITFGSILGRMGLKGETHYAIANAWQTAIAETYASTHPACDVLTLEWSIWNGAGMGHRLGSLERLARFGVDAIALDDGLEAFERLAIGGAIGTMMVTSRFGPPREISLEAVELPILRFLDKPILHYPRLELVVETELSLGRDPYLADHRVDGKLIVPGVLGLEAMAQVATALIGDREPGSIEKIAFRKAIIVPDGGATPVKIMALAGEDGRIEVVIRSGDDDFATNCMEATFVYRAVKAPAELHPVYGTVNVEAEQLYGSLFFQGERFHRISHYTAVAARQICARLLPKKGSAWFGPFESQKLILGDPTSRDAMLHALQAAVPHRRVVPIAVDRIRFLPGSEPVRIEAIERSAVGNTFVFDIVARDSNGKVVEAWDGAKFQAISELDFNELISAAPEFAAPVIERIARAELDDPSIKVALVFDRDASRDLRRGRALTALGLAGPVLPRTDGKPVVVDSSSSAHVSVAHCVDVTVAVLAKGDIGCDIESISQPIASQSSIPLSTSSRLLATKLAGSIGESWEASAVRIWALGEVAAKCGRRLDGACKAAPNNRGEVVSFDTPFGRIATIRMRLPMGEVIVAIGALTPTARTLQAAAELDSQRGPVTE